MARHLHHPVDKNPRRMNFFRGDFARGQQLVHLGGHHLGGGTEILDPSTAAK